MQVVELFNKKKKKKRNLQKHSLKPSVNEESVRNRRLLNWNETSDTESLFFVSASHISLSRNTKVWRHKQKYGRSSRCCRTWHYFSGLHYAEVVLLLLQRLADPFSECVCANFLMAKGSQTSPSLSFSRSPTGGEKLSILKGAFFH